MGVRCRNRPEIRKDDIPPEMLETKSQRIIKFEEGWWIKIATLVRRSGKDFLLWLNTQLQNHGPSVQSDRIFTDNPLDFTYLSDTNETAERAVRRVYKVTASVLEQSDFQTSNGTTIWNTIGNVQDHLIDERNTMWEMFQRTARWSLKSLWKEMSCKTISSRDNKSSASVWQQEVIRHVVRRSRRHQ